MCSSKFNAHHCEYSVFNCMIRPDEYAAKVLVDAMKYLRYVHDRYPGIPIVVADPMLPYSGGSGSGVVFEL